MRSLNLLITGQARRALKASCEQTGFEDPIPCLMWSEKIDGSDPGWMVGFWNRDDVSDEHIVIADGVEMVVEDHYRGSLAGKKLAVVRGYLKVVDQSKKV